MRHHSHDLRESIEKGLREVIAHLVEQHGHRRIGFIRGADGSIEADKRLRIYREVMADHRLDVDPEWVAPAATDWASGRRAIEILMSERKRTDLEAIKDPTRLEELGRRLLQVGSWKELLERGQPQQRPARGRKKKS